MALPETTGDYRRVTTLPATVDPFVNYYADDTGKITTKAPNGTTHEMPTAAQVALIGGGSTEESVSYQYRVAASAAPANITSGNWQDVPLATEVGSGITGASIESNVVTLPAGTYEFEYFVNAYFGGVTSAAVSAQCRLYNDTATAEITDSGGSLGTIRENDGITIGGMATSRGSVAVTFGVETDVILQTQANDGAAYGATSTWASQLCAELRIRKTM